MRQKTALFFSASAMVFAIRALLFLIVFTLFGYAIAAVTDIDQQVKSNNVQFMSIESQLSQIQADLIWIKREINNK
jgi:uncharacterized membrane protein